MAELPTLVEAVETSLAPHLAVPSLPFDADLLAGQLADSSIAMYRRDFTAYVGYAASQALDPLQPATLARWRTTLAKDTQLSPNTINRMLSAVKRLMAQAAEQGYLDHEVAETFQDLKGVKRGHSRRASRLMHASSLPRKICAAYNRSPMSARCVGYAMWRCLRPSQALACGYQKCRA